MILHGGLVVSNMQFYLAMGVPSVLVVLSWVQANQRGARIKVTVDV